MENLEKRFAEVRAQAEVRWEICFIAVSCNPLFYRRAVATGVSTIRIINNFHRERKREDEIKKRKESDTATEKTSNKEAVRKKSILGPPGTVQNNRKINSPRKRINKSSISSQINVLEFVDPE